MSFKEGLVRIMNFLFNADQKSYKGSFCEIPFASIFFFQKKKNKTAYNSNNNSFKKKSILIDSNSNSDSKFKDHLERSLLQL